MKPFLLLTFLYQLADFTAFCQNKLRPSNYSLQLMNNAVALPFSGQAGVVHTPFHFGIRGGVGFNLKQTEKYLWRQTAMLGFVHQRLVHNAFHLYTENEFTLKIWKGLGAMGSLGIGYCHLVNTPDNQVYKLESDGTYSQTDKLGVPRFLGSGVFGLIYKIETENAFWQPMLQYQFWMVAPFVKSYVPVLPNAAFQIGLLYQPKRNQ